MNIIKMHQLFHTCMNDCVNEDVLWVQNNNVSSSGMAYNRTLFVLWYHRRTVDILFISAACTFFNH